MKIPLLPLLAAAIVGMPCLAGFAQYANVPDGFADRYESRLSVTYSPLGETDREGGVFTGSLGYYFAENVAGGVYMSYEPTEYESYWAKGSAWGIGVFGEYVFNEVGIFLPYADALLGILDGQDTSDATFRLSLSGGLKFYVLENLGFFLQANVDAATHDIFNFERVHRDPAVEPDPGDGSGDSVDFSLTAGVRIML